MQTWIVKNGKIESREGSGNRIECFYFADRKPDKGDTVTIEGSDYLVLESRYARHSFIITIKKK
jgi:hypothetical protein